MNFKLDHINLTVSDINESIQWYQQVFDLKLLEQGISRDNNPWAIVGRNDSMVCMTEYKDLRNASASEQNSSHQIYHFGFRVPDREAWENTVKRYNLELYYGGINEYPHSLSWYVKDPSGHTIEVSYTEDENLRFPS